MFDRVLAIITAVTSSITALFCIWIAVNLVTCDNEMGKMMGGPAERSMASSPSATSEAEMTKEREAIKARLNSLVPKPVR